MLDSVGSDSLSYKLHSAAQRRRLVVKEGLLEVHLSHKSDWDKVFAYKQFRKCHFTTLHLLMTHLQFLLRPVGSWRISELSRSGSDLADDSSTFGCASRYKGSQELTELTWKQGSMLLCVPNIYTCKIHKRHT